MKLAAYSTAFRNQDPVALGPFDDTGYIQIRSVHHHY
jgi:hypothetical protein